MTKIIIGIVLFPFLFTYMMFTSAFALQTVWNWFTPEIYAIIPPLTLLQALAIMLVVGALKGYFQNINPQEKPCGLTLLQLVLPWICLLLAYLTKIICF